MTRPRTTPARLAALALALALAVAPRPAVADPLAVTLTAAGGRIQAEVDLGPAFPPALEEQLGNGLRNVIAVAVGLVPVGAELPVAGYARVIEVLYDVWEETWTVTVRDPQAPADRRQRVRSAAELHALLARAADGDLGPIGGLPPGPFTVDVRVDVNPISQELLARTREYLGAAPAKGSRSVLGAVAGMLLSGPGDGEDEAILLRSRALGRSEVRPR